MRTVALVRFWRVLEGWKAMEEASCFVSGTFCLILAPWRECALVSARKYQQSFVTGADIRVTLVPKLKPAQIT